METPEIGLGKIIERKKISKLHILVHPGFLMEKDIHGDEVSDEDFEAGMELLKAYKEKAKTLGKDEVMVILPASDLSSSHLSCMKEHKKLNKPYVQTIENIKSTLGKRAVVLMDRLNFFDEEEARVKLKKVLVARGYYFDENVLSEAYGETLGCCVDDAAEGFNREEKLNEKTVIKVDLTDSKGRDPAGETKRAKKFGYERITFE